MMLTVSMTVSLSVTASSYSGVQSRLLGDQIEKSEK